MNPPKSAMYQLDPKVERMIMNNEPACRIIHENGQSFLTDDKGNKLPGQIWARVTQELHKPAYAIVKVLVNLTDTVDEKAFKEECSHHYNPKQ